MPDYRISDRARPPEGVHGHGVPGRQGVGERHRGARRRKPSSGPRTRRTGAVRSGGPGALERGIGGAARSRSDAPGPREGRGRQGDSAEVTSVEERDAHHPPARQAQGLHVSRRGPQVHEGRAARQVRAAPHGQRRGARDAFRDERAVRAREQAAALPPHTHVVLTFQQGGDLRYVDPRTFGEMFVALRTSSAR